MPTNCTPLSINLSAVFRVTSSEPVTYGQWLHVKKITSVFALEKSVTISQFSCDSISISLSYFIDGTNTITVTAEDTIGNIGSASVTFVCDKTPPAVTITSPPQDWANVSKDGFEFSGIAEDVSGIKSIKIRVWDNARGEMTVFDEPADYDPVTHQWSFQVLPSHVTVEDWASLSVSIRDAVDNFTGKNRPVNVTSIDPNPPEISLTSPEEGGVYGPDVLVSGTVTDNISEITSVSISVNGSPSISATVADEAFSHELTGLTDGRKTITVTAEDDHGNIGSASVGVTVDAAPPDINIWYPPDGTTSATANITVACSINDISGLASVLISLDGDTPEEMTGLGSGIYYYDFRNLNDGLHTATITAQDEIGNEGSSSVSFTVDTTPPTITIESPIAGGLYRYIYVHGKATDDLSSISSVLISVNGDTPTESTIYPNGYFGYSIWPSSPRLIEGENTITVTAEDDAGNVGTGSVTITCDRTTPTAAISSPELGLRVPPSGFLFSGTAEDSSGIDKVLITLYSYVGGTRTTTVSNQPANYDPATKQWNFQVLASHMTGADSVYLMAICYDEAGNPKGLFRNVYVAVEAPEVKIYSLKDGSTHGSHTTVSGVVTDDVSVISSVLISVDGGSAASAGVTDGKFNHELTGLAVGPHTITVEAEDGDGNIGSASVNITVVGDTTPPTITIESPIAGGLYRYIYVHGKATDDLSSISSVLISVNGDTPTESTIYPNGYFGYSIWPSSPRLIEGENTITVTAEDDAGNVGTGSVTITCDRTTPTAAISSPELGLRVPPSGFLFSGTAEDSSGIDKVLITLYSYVGGTRTTTVSNQPANYDPATKQWNFQVLASHMTGADSVYLMAICYDEAGNPKGLFRNVYVEAAAPGGEAEPPASITISPRFQRRPSIMPKR